MICIFVWYFVGCVCLDKCPSESFQFLPVHCYPCPEDPCYFLYFNSTYFLLRSSLRVSNLLALTGKICRNKKRVTKKEKEVWIKLNFWTERYFFSKRLRIRRSVQLCKKFNLQSSFLRRSGFAFFTNCPAILVCSGTLLIHNHL